MYVCIYIFTYTHTHKHTHTHTHIGLYICIYILFNSTHVAVSWTQVRKHRFKYDIKYSKHA